MLSLVPNRSVALAGIAGSGAWLPWLWRLKSQIVCKAGLGERKLSGVSSLRCILGEINPTIRREGIVRQNFRRRDVNTGQNPLLLLRFSDQGHEGAGFYRIARCDFRF